MLDVVDNRSPLKNDENMNNFEQLLGKGKGRIGETISEIFFGKKLQVVKSVK